MSGYSGCYHSGLSGLQLPIPKYLFPPPYQDASRLHYYSTFFNSIEINSSFYKVPMASTVTKWVSSVADKFTFTFKMWREITHVKGFNFKKSDVAYFLKSVSGAGIKKGCLLVQFPPGLNKDKGQLIHLLNCIRLYDAGKEWKLAVEFRNKTWYCEEIYDVLNFFQATLVIHDIPKSATPMLYDNVDFVYVRFHGPSGNYRDGYPDSILSEYAGLIHDWLNENKTVYVYFNNTMGDAFKNLETLNKMMENHGITF